MMILKKKIAEETKVSGYLVREKKIEVILKVSLFMNVFAKRNCVCSQFSEITENHVKNKGVYAN